MKRKVVFFINSLYGGGAEKVIEKLRKFLEIEKFEAELILIDPKDKPSDEKNKKRAV